MMSLLRLPFLTHDMRRTGGWEASFERYLDHLCEALGHRDRRAGLMGYCRGLMLPLARKSVEPLAAHLDPYRVSARHQALHHFVAQSDWSDAAVLEQVRRWVLPKMSTAGGLYWIIDDSGFPKKGKHSVGVARQYCGQLGKRDNCQVAVSLSVATAEASLPVAWRLYLPPEWSENMGRRMRAGVPETVRFATKPQIALEQLRQARASSVPPGVVLADAGYGNDTVFREGITELGLTYAVGVPSSLTVWAPGTAPLPPKPWAGKGRKSKPPRRAPGHEPVSVKELALTLDMANYRTVTWREGTDAPVASRFAAVRVHPANRDYWRDSACPEEWLLIEWPAGEKEPTKYWLSSLPRTIALKRLVAQAKMCWRIKRDYQELKQEFGLAHYEGRGWRGFHHHASLCIAAYGFLVAERFSRGLTQGNVVPREKPALPEGCPPRNTRPSATAGSGVDLDLTMARRRRYCSATSTMSLLRRAWG